MLSAQDFNHKPTEPYYKDWQQADSLSEKDQPQSAARIVAGILRKAHGAALPAQEMKAQLYLLALQSEVDSDSDSDSDNEDDDPEKAAYLRADSFARNAPFPQSNIWHSVAGQMLWNYYNDDRWTILQRTAITGDGGSDPATWDAPRFFKEISAHYRASIRPASDLVAIPLEQWEAIITEGKNTRQLRPTLYDLLAFRALAWFEHDEKEITRPADAFTLARADYFAPAEDFAQGAIPVPVNDSNALQHRALRIYQQILLRFSEAGNGEALIDADLHRLAFVHQFSTLPDKKARYRQALEALAQRRSKSAGAAEALVRAIQLEMDEDAQPPRPYRRGPRAGNNPRPDKNLPALRTRLRDIIARYPGSEGAAHAAQLIAQIEAVTLTATAEEIVLPSESSKVLVGYRNVPVTYFRVIRMDWRTARELWRLEDKQRNAALLKAKPVQAFSQDMPESSDLGGHTTEVPIDALEAGNYILLMSNSAAFSPDKDVLSAVSFQVSSLAFITATGGKQAIGFVLDRTSGAGIGSAKLEFYQDRYQQSRYQQTLVANASARVDGRVMLPSNNRADFIRLSKDADEAYVTGYYNYGNSDNPYSLKKPEPRTFFFTDRAIYRLGQTVYFKGIVVQPSDKGRKNEVVTGSKSEVIFRDANGQEISRQTLTTNEFGSFSGSFTASSALTGYCTIRDAHGSVGFRVEEYKRPKFSVEFDTLKAAYRLGDEITVTGIAKAYAGNAIDGAEVKYRVTRTARFPYWWAYWRWGQPVSQQQQVAEGMATTDAAGKFNITFRLLPDATVPEASLPIFSYAITADVTDLNGETHTGNETVSAGYRSLLLSITVPGYPRLDELDTIRVSSTNPDGQFVPAAVRVSVRPLVQPDVLPRKRLWDAPDAPLLDSTEFKRRFPKDEWDGESDYRQWAEGAETFSTTATTTRDGRVRLAATVFPRNGWYVIVVSGKDKDGKEVEEKSYTGLWDARLNGELLTALSVHGVKPAYEPGETLTAHVNTGGRIGTPAGGLNRGSGGKVIEVMESTDSTGIQLRAVAASNGSDRLTPFIPISVVRAIAERDRGGLEFQWLAVQDNRVYQTSAQINVPWSNKDLDIAWETHRDKLQPGQQEEWTMTVRGPRKDKVAAEMVATLYDASLDALAPHGWGMGGLFPMIYRRVNLGNNHGFGTASGNQLAYGIATGAGVIFEKKYEDLIGIDGYSGYLDFARSGRGGIYTESYSWSPGMARDGAYEQVALSAAKPRAAYRKGDNDITRKVEAGNVSFAAPVAAADEEIAMDKTTPETPPPPPGQSPADIPLRKNLQELAFFQPQLKTDAQGNVLISFTIPEALTDWRLMAFAHTPDMKTGAIGGNVKTQKDLMVTPGLPRFFRQGDELVISTKIANLSDAALKGTAYLEIVDAATLQPLNLQFGFKESTVVIAVPKEGSASAIWKVRIPQSRYEPVLVRIRASAGNFTDGEENPMPVLTNRMLVTETVPMWMNGAGTKHYTIPSLTAGNAANGNIAPYALTLEYTPNPAWLAVQALPYLTDYPYECAEQTFNRFYANALAAHIVKLSPKVKEVFRQWEKSDTTALLSALEKNQELKTALLEETPWVAEAKTETEQKHRIAMLFEGNRIAKQLGASAQKLSDMQLSDGAFPWFRGDRADRYITQYITTGIGRLRALGVDAKVLNGAAGLNRILEKALPYLDTKLQEDYEALIRNKARLDDVHISYTQVQYLYLRSFFKEEAVLPRAKKAYDYYRSQAQKHWAEFSPQGKAMLAMALYRTGDAATPRIILQSLRETSRYKEELGRYWREPGYSYWWYDAPIETQSLIIEAFAEAGNDMATVDEARRWLLKQKQTQNWESTKATADACYALLLRGGDWLTTSTQATISTADAAAHEPISPEPDHGAVRTVGVSRILLNTASSAQAGTGYAKVRIAGKDLTPDMAGIVLTVSNNSPTGAQPSSDNRPATNSPSWGAAYYQFFQDLDQIKSAATPLVVEKKLFIKRNTATGPQLSEITAGNQPRIGDRVVSRIILRADRDMEYVHLKDMRAACFEPVNVLSGYRWEGGLGYYESTRDAATNYFISYLRQGTYVFEHEVTVTNKGGFSNGISTAQCMYAPEFSARSAGTRVMVE